MNKKTFISIALTMVITGLAWTLLTPVLFPTALAGSEAVPHPGFKAPDFSLQRPAGENVTLSELQGDPVLVFLWASWCSICKATMPDLEAVYQDYQSQGFRILAVNVAYQDDQNAAEAYFNSMSYSYTMLLDLDGSVAKKYRVHALPTAVLVAPDGTVTKVVIGGGLNRATLSAMLETYTQKED